VWYFVRASDCQFAAPRIAALNAMDMHRDTQVVGVLVDPPHDSADAVRVAASFGTTFRLVSDTDGRWARALAREGHAMPVSLVRVRGEIAAIASLGDGLSSRSAVLDLAGISPHSITSLDSSGTADTLLGARRFLPGSPTRTASYRGGSEARLVRPELLAAEQGGGVYAYDYEDRLLKAFTSDGRLRWTYGRAERGDSVFSNPTDIKIDSQGNILLPDIRSNTLSVIAPSGRLVRRTPMQHSVMRIVPAAGGAIWGFDPSSDSVAGFLFDVSGRILRTVPVPAYLRRVPAIARASFAAALPGSDSIAMVHQYAGAVSLWNPATGAGTVAAGIESIGFPEALSWKVPGGGTLHRISPRAIEAARGVTADQTRIYVLFRGGTSLAGRLIDVYSRNSGQYEGSYRFPEPVAAIARVPEGFVTTSGEPNPSVSFWRVTSRVRAAR